MIIGGLLFSTRKWSLDHCRHGKEDKQRCCWEVFADWRWSRLFSAGQVRVTLKITTVITRGGLGFKFSPGVWCQEAFYPTARRTQVEPWFLHYNFNLSLKMLYYYYYILQCVLHFKKKRDLNLWRLGVHKNQNPHLQFQLMPLFPLCWALPFPVHLHEKNIGNNKN